MKVVVINDKAQRLYISENDAEMDVGAVEAVRPAIYRAKVCKKTD